METRIPAFSSTRHVKHFLAYHFVWIPKYRRDILTGKVAERLKQMLKEFAGEIGCEVISLEVMPDHVHVFLRAKPDLAPARIINHLKGKSARKLLQEFPELRTKTAHGRLWSRSYFVASAGYITDEIVKHYVETQWERELKRRGQ
ncbi:MAG TPA: IS200/IS605-like element ISTsi3 family transposase [Thermococcaceae archaeon]|uniref:IS element ISTsi3 orfA-like, probably transposase n=1 Tax=Thermococcus sibiricus TaxID=172049 RepID=A0A117L1D9_9EURY|nr:IS200/IS605-like element ISTsi3 family transposase [Thermococcus sibiricus]KUK17816.1 MAG: IS element ISTsi3 orfA-like, probably transposase [Thermococcus sibiricus]KUK28666.1 MAG: IS element ISTsi3 orfA-like, probably transposase [Thermococcus sp. 40_45]HII67675.1 IS200/IS605-like element ISTsi3 family transposase [Thermococcaceae archaeon]